MSRAVVLGCTSALLLGPVAATGCTFEMAPVMNVQANAPLVREASAEEMKAAIYRALVTKTWVVTAEEPWKITASVTAGGHTATVLITYNTTAYSITRVDSSPGLKYESSHPRHGEIIHKRYNHWVNLLNQQIQREMSSIGATPPAA